MRQLRIVRVKVNASGFALLVCYIHCCSTLCDPALRDNAGTCRFACGMSVKLTTAASKRVPARARRCFFRRTMPISPVHYAKLYRKASTPHIAVCMVPSCSDRRGLSNEARRVLFGRQHEPQRPFEWLRTIYIFAKSFNSAFASTTGACGTSFGRYRR